MNKLRDLNENVGDVEEMAPGELLVVFDQVMFELLGLLGDSLSRFKRTRGYEKCVVQSAAWSDLNRPQVIQAPQDLPTT